MNPPARCVRCPRWEWWQNTEMAPKIISCLLFAPAREFIQGPHCTQTLYPTSGWILRVLLYQIKAKGGRLTRKPWVCRHNEEEL